jgi:hypothetical protein
LAVLRKIRFVPETKNNPRKPKPQKNSMKTKTKTKMQRWLPSLIAAVALAGSAGVCMAQAPVITLSNDSSQSPAFYDGYSPVGTEVYTWQATGGPNGGGCIKGTIDGTTTVEFDPSFNVSFVTAQYYLVTFQMMVDPSSGTTPPPGPPTGGFGNLQCSFRDTSYSWNGVGYATIFPPAAEQWVTYTYAVPSVPNMAHLQFQLQATAGYSGPVTIYIGDVTILPVPNPLLLNAFTNSASVNWQNYGMAGTWDSAQDAPYYNAVTGAGPVNITPAGSVEISGGVPSTYSGGQLNDSFNPQLYEWVAFDLYYDGPSPNTSTNYAGFQMFIANGSSPYNWAFIGNYNFTAADVGTWKHFTFPCASTGIGNGAGFALQATPGAQGTNATDPITFHIDNIQLWNPVTHPVVSLAKNSTPGGVQIYLDGNGLLNPNDQEGICTPSATNAVTDFFWMNQTPATYAFTLTNFPAPATPFASVITPPPSPGAGYDAHIYIWNGDSITAFGNDFGYNQTYSGPNFNVLDDIELHVQNAGVLTNNGAGTFSLSNGVVAIIDWKTNAPNQNATNSIVFNFPTMASANGTWALNFTSNTGGNLVDPTGTPHAFTLPDFQSDPNYNANFTPVTSAVSIGIFKNGNTNNNTLGNVFTRVALTNTVVSITDNFAGPGLTASNAWQVAEYYQYAANRVLWVPAGTAYWLKWNSTQTGYSVLSTNSLSGGHANWPNAGVTYTYTDPTGTNTVGAIPAATLPSGGINLYEVMHP